MNIPEYDGIGVYALIDKENGKRYIGSSKNVKKRICQHIKSFENKKCSNKLLVAVEQGHEFDIEILERIPYGVNQFFMFERETFYIKKYNALEDGYNCAPTTASTKEDLLESLKHLKKNSEMAKYIIEIIRKRQEPIYKSHLRAYAKHSCRIYDQWLIAVPKGKKEEYDHAAEKAGYDSRNKFILDAIEEKIAREQ